MSYEYQIRKLVCRKINFDGMDFATALTDAMIDLVIKERYFITPTAYIMAGAKRGVAVAALHPAPPVTAGAVKGRGKDGALSRKQRLAAKRSASEQPSAVAPVAKAAKGKGKGKGKARKTPDGRIICLAHNTAAGCSFVNCKFLHICTLCYSAEHICLTCTV